MPSPPTAEQHTPAQPSRRPRRRLESAQELRSRRKRVATYALFAVSLVLVVNALFGESGYLATVRAEREYAEVLDELTRTRMENQNLRDEISRLDTDPTAVEEAAREQLGLIKPGETVVILKDEAKDPAPGSGRR